MRSEGNAPRSGKPARRGRASGPLGPDATASDRPAQVGGEIRRAIQSELARGLNDPRVQGLVTVTEVMVTPDFSEARIGVSVMPHDRASLTLSGLRAASGFLRRRIMDETRIGRVPRLIFESDESIKREAALDAALREGRQGESARGAGGDASESNTR
jgi:ribosome-binding factor A